MRMQGNLPVSGQNWNQRSVCMQLFYFRIHVYLIRVVAHIRKLKFLNHLSCTSINAADECFTMLLRLDHLKYV